MLLISLEVFPLATPDNDIIIYNNEKFERRKLEIDMSEKQRISDLTLLCSKHKYFYIRKGYYYCPDACGYTERKEFAGVYSSDEAFSHARSCRETTLIPIDIEKHNKMIQESIEDLSSRIIID